MDDQRTNRASGGIVLAVFWVVVAYLVVAVVETFWHWYAATQETSVAHWLKAWYLYHDASNGKAYIEGLADLFIPAIMLGFGAGCITAFQEQRVLLWCALLLSFGIIALFPYYAVVIPTKDSNEWWTFASYEIRAFALVLGYMKAAMLSLFFGFGGRWMTQYFHGIRPDMED